MKNLWPDNFSENEQIPMKLILEEQAKLLPKLTGDLIYAEVSELNLADQDFNNDLSYRFDIKGKFSKKYRFWLLSFSHDITLYPVEIRLDEVLSEELQLLEIITGQTITINEPEQVEEFLASVLRSERVSKVIGFIMKLSK